MARFHDLAIALVGVTPSITRRFLLAEHATLQDLHVALQDLAGWQDRHLYDFRSDEDDGILTDLVDPNSTSSSTLPEPKDVDVVDAFHGRTALFYVYDPGDEWCVRITSDGVSSFDTSLRRLLLEGCRAFPLDDMGGLRGYERAIAVVFDRDKPRDRGTREWLGNCGWHPEVFDVVDERQRFDRAILPRFLHERPHSRSPRKKKPPPIVTSTSSLTAMARVERSAWCVALDVEPPDVLVMARHADVKVAHLAQGLLFRQGTPMTADALADELGKLGIATGTGNLRLSIQRAFASPSTPVKRDEVGRYYPDFDNGNIAWTRHIFTQDR